MSRRAWLAGGLLPLAALLLTTGCSTPTQQKIMAMPEPRVWSGRIGLSIASEPPQFFSALFELKGNASDGELILTSPLGSTIARLRWSHHQATWQTAQDVRAYDSIETLTQQVVGTSLPLRELFDWLEGINTHAAGWHAELNRLEQGHLTATRATPTPTAQLRLRLDQ